MPASRFSLPPSAGGETKRTGWPDGAEMGRPTNGGPVGADAACGDGEGELDTGAASAGFSGGAAVGCDIVQLSTASGGAAVVLSPILARGLVEDDVAGDIEALLLRVIQAIRLASFLIPKHHHRAAAVIELLQA